MSNLKSLRIRIQSVVSTRKITSAMKMVAASKLRRAQEQAETSKPYVDALSSLVKTLVDAKMEMEDLPSLLKTPEKDHTELVIVATSDRGLCGNFNGSIIRAARRHIANVINQGKSVHIMCIGKKAHEQLSRHYGNFITDYKEGLSKRAIKFDDAKAIADDLAKNFEEEKVTSATLIFNTFKSAIASEVTILPLVPVMGDMESANQNDAAQDAQEDVKTIATFEPNAQALLEDILPRMIAVQIFSALLNNTASEHAARMTAMDNATRNATDMIDGLKLNYNRTRQAFITKELTEIVSGAEAL